MSNQKLYGITCTVRYECFIDKKFIVHIKLYKTASEAKNAIALWREKLKNKNSQLVPFDLDLETAKFEVISFDT